MSTRWERMASALTRHLVAVGGAAAVAATALIAVSRPALLSRQDARVYDQLVQWTPATAATGRVAIVDIDERSVAEIGQWPWRRDVIAQLIERARDLGAVSIALDVLMPEPDRIEQPDTRVTSDRAARGDTVRASDAILVETLARGRVVVGYALTFTPQDRDAPPCTSHPLPLAIARSRYAGDEMPLVRATGAICSLPAFERAAETSGFLNAVPDVDGVLRRVPLLMELSGRIYPGLGLAAMMTAKRPQTTTLRIENPMAATLVVDDRVVPLDGRGNLLLGHRGRKRTLPYVSAADLLHGRVPPDRLRNTVVFVGATALGTVDSVTTPLDTLVPGVEIQAMVAEALLAGDFVARPDDAIGLEAGAGVGLALLLMIVGVVKGTRWSFGVAALGLVIAWFASWRAFSQGIFVSPLLPTCGALITLAAVTLTGFARERLRADRAASDLRRSNDMVVQSLLAMTEVWDADTGSHLRRTQTYTRMLATELSRHDGFREYLTPSRVESLSRLAALHDIGKVGVSESVLNKPGRLTSAEYAEVKNHPAYGRDVIANAARDAGVRYNADLALAQEIVYTHHERWDGQGYPLGLKAEQIPICGRVVAVVDSFDAVVTKRVYRDAMPFEMAIATIAEGRGSHFEPAIVDAFLRIAPALRHVHDAPDARHRVGV